MANVSGGLFSSALTVVATIITTPLISFLKQRTNRSVNKTADQNRFISWLAFSAHKASWHTTYRVKFFPHSQPAMENNRFLAEHSYFQLRSPKPWCLRKLFHKHQMLAWPDVRYEPLSFYHQFQMSLLGFSSSLQFAQYFSYNYIDCFTFFKMPEYLYSAFNALPKRSKQPR